MIKNWLIISLTLAVVVLLGYTYFSAKLFTSQSNESAQVVLEKMKKVTKLTIVEANFSEIYSHKESYEYDFFNLFTKKILLRVNAKVSLGFDFENINISIDSISKTITLNERPKAQILSIDHDIDYYDISEGTFNSFSPEEYTKINKNAKNLILQKANNLELLQETNKQYDDYISMISMALQSGGWRLITKDNRTELHQN